jgi:predicted GNAT family N-acyltransferase
VSPARVFVAEWSRDAPVICAVRTAVFVEEQGVPAALDVDGQDPQATHVLAVLGDRPIGTGRMLTDGHIGRLAVLQEARGAGIGAALLRLLVEVARDRGLYEVVLGAQLHAVPFYERHGFVARGQVYEEAAIAHREMARRLA